MAAWRVCGLIALAHLALAASNDDSSLVQSHVGLHRQKPGAVSAAEELVAACADLLPLEPAPANASKDSKKLADSVVAAFRDEKFVRTVNEAVGNVTGTWRYFNQVTAWRVQKLSHFKLNKTKERVVNKLHKFWLKHGVDLSRALAAEAQIRAVVSEAVPEGYLRELHPASKHAKKYGPSVLFNITFKYLNKKINDTVDGVFANANSSEALANANASKALCDRIGVMIGNLSSVFAYASPPIGPMAIKADKSAKKKSELESAVKSFAPKEGKALLKHLNATYSMASEVRTLLQGVISGLKQGNSKLLVPYLKCQQL